MRINRKRRRIAIRNCVEPLESRLLLTTYYVSTTGSDTNNGTSTSTPWASVTKVDNTTFQPGDQILFQRGDEWHGLLIASASGTAANPIVYGAYGTGVDPIFDGSDPVAAGDFTEEGTSSIYAFPVADVPVDPADNAREVFWVYYNHTMFAADTSDSNMPVDSFYSDGTNVYINTGGPDPITAGNYIVTVGDRGDGTNANSSLIDSNGFSYITFENIWGRETAEVGSGGSLTGGINDGYVFRIQGGSNVTLLNDEADDGSKHNVGAIDTNNFTANDVTAQYSPIGVSGNGLPYGNATAFVAYADNGGGNNFDLINCTVENYGGSQPAFLTHEVNPGDIDSITLTDFVTDGSPIALEPGSNETITFNGGEITNNTLTAYGATGTTIMINGMTFDGNGSAVEIYGGATVQNCLFDQTSQSGASIQVSGANNLIRFNTIDSGSYTDGIIMYSGVTGAVIYGNLFTGQNSDISVASNDTFSADYDFYDTTVGAPQFYVSGNTDSLSQFQAAGYETHAVQGNPDFVGSGANPFSLQSTSPAINIVPTTNITGVNTDILGNPRPSGSAYDAGAYEFQIAQYPPTVATAAAANPNPVTSGSTTALSVLGADQSGESNLTYTWSLTGTPPATVTYTGTTNGTNAAKNITANFTKAGTYDFLVTIVDGQYSITSSVNVTVDQVATSLVVTPPAPFVSINTTQQFTATVEDQFGNAIANASVSWVVLTGQSLGTINSSGLYTAGGTTGNASVQATSGSITGSTTLKVTPPNQAPTVATAASATPNPVTNNTTALSVLGADDNGEANLTYTWSLLGSPPAPVAYSGTTNGTNAAKNITATFTANGTYDFLVTITDSGGLSTTSTVNVTVSTITPITVDGKLDNEYGSPIVLQTQATNYGNGAYTGPGGNGATAPYSQLVAGYGVIDETNGKFDLFLAGSVDLNNAALDLFIDSVPGSGVSNLSGLSSSDFSSAFQTVSFDTGFSPDYLFSFGGGGGEYLTYSNLNTETDAYLDMGHDPASSPDNDSANTSIPQFTVAVNNTADTSIIQPANASSVTTGFEISFSLSGLGYTTADFNANDPINVLALISYGSHTVATNQFLAPYTPQQSALNQDGGIYTYFGNGNFALGNQSRFPGNQFFTVNTPSPATPAPTIQTAAAANPNPTTGLSTQLSVLGADQNGESTLTYTWSLLGTPPGPVSYTVTTNGSNAAKNITANFTTAGTYNFLVTVSAGSQSATSTVTVTVNPSIGVATAASGTVSSNGKSASLSVLGSDPSGESNLTYTWSVTSVPNGNAPPPIYSANATNAAKNTTATFFQAGSYTFLCTITDTSGNMTTSSVTIIVAQLVTEMYVSPANASISINSTQQYSVTHVYDQFLNTVLAPNLSWAVSGGGTISTGGLLTPSSDGTFTVTATSGSYVASTSVTITGTLSGVSTPTPPTTPPTTSTTTSGSTSGSGSTTTTTTSPPPTTSTGKHKKTPKPPKPVHEKKDKK